MKVIDVIAKTVADAQIYKIYEDFSNELLYCVRPSELHTLGSVIENEVSSYTVCVVCALNSNDLVNDENDILNIVEIRMFTGP